MRNVYHATSDADTNATAGRGSSATSGFADGAAELSPLADVPLAAVQFQLGVAHELDGRCDEAQACYRTALELNPTDADAHANLGGVLRRLGKLPEALAHLSRAVQLDSGLYRACHNLAQVQHDLGDFDGAIDGYRQALDLSPNAYESLVNLATVQSQAGKFNDAVATFRQAISVQPLRAEAYNNFGQCWQAQGRFDDALCQFDAALERAPDDVEVHLNRAFLWLQYGDFSRGWREYEWRSHKQRTAAKQRLLQPLWQGQPLASRRILVYAEQGLGDEIMFLTCLTDLVAEAAQCTVVCDHRLAKLVARSFPLVRVVACQRGAEPWEQLAQLQVDYQTPAGTLPRFLRPNVQSFAPCRSLLIADSALRQTWKTRLAALGPGKKVGLAWRGGVKHPAEIRQRSIPPHCLADLTRTPGVEFVVLQHDARPEEIDALRAAGGTVHVLPGLDLRDDLDATAAVLAELDLVIAAAGAVVHLAGAVGAPTWLLLPQHWGWRWLTGREDSVWYASLRVRRQPAHGDWPGLLDAVKADLAVIA